MAPRLKLQWLHPDSYLLLKDTFASFWQFFCFFGVFQKCSDAFGSIRMGSDIFGCVWMRSGTSEIFGKFSEKTCIILKILNVFGGFTRFLDVFKDP